MSNISRIFSLSRSEYFGDVEPIKIHDIKLDMQDPSEIVCLQILNDGRRHPTIHKIKPEYLKHTAMYHLIHWFYILPALPEPGYQIGRYSQIEHELLNVRGYISLIPTYPTGSDLMSRISTPEASRSLYTEYVPSSTRNFIAVINSRHSCTSSKDQKSPRE